MDVVKQVLSIYAVTNGHLDDLEPSGIQNFEEDFHQHLEAKYGDLLDGVRDKKQMDDDLKAKADQAIQECKEAFIAKQA